MPVSLDGGGAGWVLPGDDEAAPDAEPWAALLPVLDPTTMGWRDRDWYLDPADTPYLFDSNGNGGTTAWWNGRIVGCWVQDAEGRVVVVPRGELSRAAAHGARRRGRATHGLARRRDDQQRLQLAADEVRAIALTVHRTH